MAFFMHQACLTFTHYFHLPFNPNRHTCVEGYKLQFKMKYVVLEVISGVNHVLYISFVIEQ